jgi:hypothetical protein
MIIDLRFGYAARHHIYYDTQRKRGTLKLWSSYSGSIIGVVPVKNHEGLPSKSITRQKARDQRETLFRANQHTEFLITDENDVFSFLASLVAVIHGQESSFTSREGRKITLSLKKEENWDKDVITVKIQYGQAGKLTIGEAHKLQTITRDILRNLGYYDQEISKKLENISQASTI